jgi:cob(I)alamin adenosyltransferase
MVKLDKIYTRAGDKGSTRLASGAPVPKWSLRVEAYGAVDETNSAIGVARLATASDLVLDPLLARVQHDLFDLGADLATPETPAPRAQSPRTEALRIQHAQVERLEREIDMLNGDLAPLTSFVLPGGSPAAAHLHMARTICRRAERLIAHLASKETVNPDALSYANRLSDLLFVAARWANERGAGDVLWVPGANR